MTVCRMWEVLEVLGNGIGVTLPWRLEARFTAKVRKRIQLASNVGGGRASAHCSCIAAILDPKLR